MKRHLAVWSLGIMVCAANAQDLNVLPPSPPTPKGTNAPLAMLDAYLKSAAFAALDKRKSDYEKVKTPEQVTAWQQQRREFFVQQLGGFPKRTPLNGKVTGTMDGSDYRVEKVIFESEPKHHVTGLLYLPKTPPPYPGVIVPCGHSTNGKGAETYQRASILLAKNGLAAFCYDPIGQGERAQVLKPDGKAALGSTTEHTLVGIGAILVGRNVATYRIWDGMRAIDYLQSRPEIDPKRIGCTGNSGGGTLTSYLMALDDRIVAAAPSCYLTSFRKLLERIGGQDGEQNIFGQIAFGMEHGDYVIMRAPKPTLMCVATRDMFDILGSWDSFREAKRIYGKLGFANHVDLVEADEPHGFSTHLRVGAVRWMRRWLLKVDDDIIEPDFPIRKDPEIQCSEKGQVMLMPGEKSVFDLNADAEKKLAVERRELWSKSAKTDALAKVREVAGVRPLDKLQPAKCRAAGSVERRGYRIEKLVLEPEAGIVLPALAFVPPKPNGNAYLYLNGQGKQADAAPGGPIEQLVTQGHLVLAVDLRGLGETVEKARKWYSGSFGPVAGDFYHSYLLGCSLVGMWTEDVLVCARFLAGYETKGAPRKVHLVGVGAVGIPALHAAALEPELIVSLTLRRTLASWASVLREPAAKDQLITTIHGALKVYDLPDLVAAFGKDKVRIEEPINTDGSVVASPKATP
ncbi:MAG: acetylxylan esterase [Verrucomicrobia bacterium]|nr:acetylxylan esterase [Verrucomicrobiota bacterium]